MDSTVTDFTPEELRLAIEAFGEQMAGANEAQSLEECAALFDFAVSKLVEVRPTYTPEAELLADEESISGFALGAIEAARRVTGNNKIGSVGAILTKHTQRPLFEKKKVLESAQKSEVVRLEVSELKDKADEIESPFYKTAREIRGLNYKVGDIVQKGTYLERKVEELGIFSDRESRFLAGISLEPFDMHRFAQLKHAIDDSTKVWKQIGQKGGGVPKDGLVSAIAKLREFADANPKHLSDPSYKPLLEFIEKYELSEDELIERLLNEMDMGIFENAPELPIVPFSENGHEPWVGSDEEKTEIKKQDFNEENIVKDLNKSANMLGYSIIVEPQRIKDFIDLHSKLVNQYGEVAIRIYRTLRPNWHPLPWMVIEVQRPNKPSVVALEIAVYGNASYVISNEDWFNTLGSKRKEARKLPGVKGFNHEYNERAEIVDQTNRLYNCVRTNYDRR